MKKDSQKVPEKTEELEHGSAWLIIGKIVFLLAVLAAAWFVLDWLISGK